MNILIIGASGLVGSNLIAVFKNEKIISTFLGTHLSFETANTVFFDPIKEIPLYITNIKWDFIIHTGALTNVDFCENNEVLSYELTVLSTLKILELAVNCNAKFVYISTDYVFNGESGPYRENEKYNPLNVYGKHKVLAEKLVIDYRNYLIVRITNVYGNELRHKNFVSRIIETLKTQNIIDINAPLDQYATPINAFDVARAILLLIVDNKNGIYHLSSTDYMTRVQLLQRMNLFLSNKINIKPIQTVGLKQAALRPLKGGLIAEKFIAEYPNFIFTNIDDYLKATL